MLIALASIAGLLGALLGDDVFDVVSRDRVGRDRRRDLPRARGALIAAVSATPPMFS